MRLSSFLAAACMLTAVVVNGEQAPAAAEAKPAKGKGSKQDKPAKEQKPPADKSKEQKVAKDNSAEEEPPARPPLKVIEIKTTPSEAVIQAAAYTAAAAAAAEKGYCQGQPKKNTRAGKRQRNQAGGGGGRTSGGAAVAQRISFAQRRAQEDAEWEEEREKARADASPFCNKWFRRERGGFAEECPYGDKCHFSHDIADYVAKLGLRYCAGGCDAFGTRKWCGPCFAAQKQAAFEESGPQVPCEAVVGDGTCGLLTRRHDGLCASCHESLGQYLAR